MEAVLSSARRSLLLLLPLTVTACASSQGEALMKEGAFAQAETRFTADLDAHPDDASLRQRRDEARDRAFRDRLAKARESQATGHSAVALAFLAEALKLERKWKPLALSPETSALRSAALGDAEPMLQAAIAPDLADHRLLRAAVELERLQAAFSEPALAPAMKAARARLHAEGQTRCADLTRAATTPYLLGLVARYCARLDVVVQAPVPPDARRGLRISGEVEHTTEANHTAAHRWLAHVFRESPWYAADAAELFDVKLSGSFDPKISQDVVTLSAPYRTTVRSEIDQGPLRPALRVVSEEDRVFTYEAQQYTAHYEVDVDARFELVSTLDPVRVSFEAEDDRRAYTHKVSFPPAGVYPQNATLPTAGDWLIERLKQERKAASEKLVSFWSRAFCRAKAPSPEEAARCARGLPRTPGVAKALGPIFGADTLAFIDLLAEPPRPRKGGALPETVDTNVPRTGDGSSI